MNSTLTRTQKSLVFILSVLLVLCGILLVFTSIECIELREQYSTISSLKYSVNSLKDDVSELNLRKPLQDHSNYYLLGKVAAGNQKLIKLKNEPDVIYTWSDCINEEYDKARKDEYLSAFKAAISTDENLRERVLYYLHDLCGYGVAMPYTLADPDEADEASKAIALEHFINRLELSPSGHVLYYPFDGDIRPYYTDFTIRYISSSDFDYFDENSGRGPVFKTAENYEPKYNEYDIPIWYDYQSAGLCCICF